MAARNEKNATAESYALPHRETNTAVVESIKLPSNRRALFLAVPTPMLHDTLSDELSFAALSPNDRATLQFLLYLTYCCKGEFLQVTLENPDFCTMSSPIREDYAHGRLFCFILDMSGEDSQREDGNNPQARGLDSEDYVTGSQLVGFMNVNVNMEVFRQGGGEEDEDEDDRSVNETLEEAFNAFMRLQLVRKRASSLNNALVVMRDSKGELSSMFDWVDICCDTLNSSRVDRKRVRELQGSMFTPACQTGRQVLVLPETVTDLSVKALDESLGRITDSASKGEGKALFTSIVSKLTGMHWLKHAVVRTVYNADMRKDVMFVDRLKAFTRDIRGSTGIDEVDVRGLLVFRYSMEKLVSVQKPDLFVRSLLHKHISVTENRMEKALWDLRGKRRTRALASLLKNGKCLCAPKTKDNRGAVCGGRCQTAYSLFYNSSECHPLVVSRTDRGGYLARLYPQLGKLERLSREMKEKYKGRRQFESIAEMVFNVLVTKRYSESQSLYDGLVDVLDANMSNSSLSLGGHLPEIHESLYLAPGVRKDYSDELSSLSPVKVYDHALVRYLFCDSLQVGRLFQASTTFNYIIVNSAPRYTIERIMLFNITGTGEGKSYANAVLCKQFSGVSGCIEILTSFTPQSFKYKNNRNACVVILDDAHISHEKSVRASDIESNVIPNTFKNLLDNSVLESDVVTRDMNCVKCQAVHNCGFVWNTNTLGFVSAAWADRCLIMESEFSGCVTRTRSSNQIQSTIAKHKMDRIASVCLYRQNLIQSATMIAESEIMQFGARFDAARDACLTALYASHIVCTGAIKRRVSFCVNQLVFAEAMKLACHFVFDVWIPPWTEMPDEKDHPDVRSYMRRMNENRMKALDELSFGQLCLETNAVYKLCVAACLPDICPRAVDMQGRFACRVLGYILTQIHSQHLKTSSKSGRLCVSGIDGMFFSEKEVKGDNAVAHDMITLCATCKVPSRDGSKGKTYSLCTYRLAPAGYNAHTKRGHQKPPTKVSSVSVPLEAVYDMLALYAPTSHATFWDRLSTAMVEAYESGDFGEQGNAFGQCWDEGGGEREQIPTLTFTLDFNQDPVCSTILEATAAVEPLSELTFNKCVLDGEKYQCSAPLYYGGVIKRAMSENAPKGTDDERHLKESRLGPRGTFHGPRLRVYSLEYSGVPVKNVSSFCTTRTVYDQDRIMLRVDTGDSHGHLVQLEEDWEWKDAADVFNYVHGTEVFSVDALKRDYAATMMVAKGELITAPPEQSPNLTATKTALLESNGRAALAMRRGSTRASKTSEAAGAPGRSRAHREPTTSSRGNKRTEGQQSRDSADGRPRAKRKRSRLEDGSRDY